MKTYLLLLGWVWALTTTAAVAAGETSTPRELNRLRRDAVDHPRDAKPQKKLAAYCLKNHLEDEALTASEAAVALNPEDREAQELRVTALAHLGRYADATNSWPETLAGPSRQFKKTLEAATIAGQAMDMLNRAGAAADNSISPGDLAPQPFSPDNPLKETPGQTVREEYENAAQLMEKSLSLDPDNAALRLTLGWVYLDRLYEPRQAYPHLADAARWHPNDVNARKLFGLACLQTGQPHRAVTQFRAAALLAPDDEWVKVQLGKSLARTGHYHDANELYTQVLAMQPTNADARLGKAELSAWEGHTAGPLQDLDALIAENPNNLDALVLRGNVHQWNWDLTEAQLDYSNALAISPGDYEARNGLEQVDVKGATSLEADGYWFRDNAGFLREYGQGGARVHLTDHAYLLADGAEWHFSQQSFTNLNRTDGSAGLEINWSRMFTTTAEGDFYKYHDRDGFFGGHGTGKLSLAPGYDIYAAGAYHQPFISSINTVVTNMKQDIVGGGLDFRIAGPLSVQNGFQFARLTDGNNWWEDKPQLSLLLYEHWQAYLRVQYDYLTYHTAEPAYFSPMHWRTVGPVGDIAIPIGKFLTISADAQGFYVFNESKLGDNLTVGPVLNLTSHFQLRGSYLQTSVPGDQGQWSGHGWQAAAVVRF